MKQRAFTLIEIMVALAIFALLALICSGVLYQGFQIHKRLQQKNRQLVELQMAILYLQQDTAQMIARSVRSKNMRLLPAFIGNPQYLEFTRSGLQNPGDAARKTSLQRLAYLCQQGRLIRRSWQQLDEANPKNYQDRILLDKLQACSFSFLSKEKQMLSSWKAAALAENPGGSVLPLALLLSVKPKPREDMSLLFVIPEGLYA